MLLIRNGYYIDPRSGREGEYDVLVEGGRISRVVPRGTLSADAQDHVKAADEALPAEADDHTKAVNQALQADGSVCRVIDAAGCIVAPGLVDVHVHFRDPGFTYKEDIETGAAAAAAGGYTTVVLMANTKPTVDNGETLRYVLEKGRKTGIHVESCAAVTHGLKGETLTDMAALRTAGAAGFTDDGIPLMDERLVREAMIKTAQFGVPISFHEEDKTLISENGINRGAASAHFGVGGSPREAEITLVRRDLEMAIETGAIINIQHISTKEAVSLVREAKKRSNHIHAEATPHHIALTEEALIQKGTVAKMNPPLRTEEDRQAIIEGLIDGTIDLIATDHAPHSAEEKARPLTEAPSGLIGLETALPVCMEQLVKSGRMTMLELLRRMSANPADMYGLPAGGIEEGCVADIVVFQPDELWTAQRFHSRSQNSPFIGESMIGKVHYTICAGRIVYSGEERYG